MSLVLLDHLKVSFILYTQTSGHNSGKILGHKLQAEKVLILLSLISLETMDVFKFFSRSYYT